MQTIIRNIFVVSVFLFPFIYSTGFLFPAVAPRALFAYFVAELLLLLYLWYAFHKGKFEFKKSYVTIALVIYIGILFLTALVGVDFGKSFWSSYNRMTGIVTWLHYFGLFFVVSSVFKKEDWKYVFRAIMLSGAVLAITSWIGEDGFNTGIFPYLKDGSFLGNESYSGAYFLLVFFLSFIGIAFEKRKIWKWTYISALAIIFFSPDLFNFDFWSGGSLNPMGGARASALVLWAGLIALGLLFAVRRFVKSRKFVAGSAAFLLVAILAVYGLGFASILSGEGFFYDKFSETDDPARLMLWDIALDGIKERPILGYGPDNFDYVFDRRLDATFLTFEANLSFDRAHNFTLDEIVGTGALGILAMLLIFVVVTYKSIQLYLKENKFYFLIIPFVLVFHFLQLQTFFDGPGALLLVFIMLAFLVSHRESSELVVPARKLAGWFKAGIAVAFIAAFYFWIYIPTIQNRLYIKLSSGATISERQELLPQLKELKVDPLYTLNLLSDGLIRGSARYKDRFDEPAVRGAIQGEFRTFFTLYESYGDRYEDNYKYLFQYGKIINEAYTLLGIDELKKGEEFLNRAIAISDGYPHPYALLAMNLYFQERYDEALVAVERAIEIDPSDQSQRLYDLILKRGL